jgi:hypothetical protein
LGETREAQAGHSPKSEIPTTLYRFSAGVQAGDERTAAGFRHTGISVGLR